MLKKMLHKPTKWKVMKELILKDTEDTVINSLGIISSLSQVSHGSEDILRIPIGFSVWDTYSDVFRTMKYAMEKHLNDSDKLFQFNIYADKIRTVDAHKLTKIGNV